MKKVAIMQPYVFPYLGYFQLINSVDLFIIYDDVNYINKGWINRNNILINGNGSLFTIPLIGGSQNKLINEIELSNDFSWKKKLLKTIEQTYKKADNFEESFVLISKIINFEEINLSKYITNSLCELCNYLGINTEIKASSSIYENQILKAKDRILDICKRENASIYINPIGGKELYSKSDFLEKGIDLKFINSGKVAYKQFNNDFVPWLSIIDVLMFNNKLEISRLLEIIIFE